MPNDTTTDAPPKAFHLDLDTVPALVRDEVMAKVRDIQGAIESAPIMAAVLGYCESVGIVGASAIPRGCLLTGAWVTIFLKDHKHLVELRRLLAQDGWRFSNHSDYPEERRFVITLHRGPLEDVGLNVHIGGEGAKCQYVPNGTKTVTTYKLVCDGAEVKP